MSGSQKWLLWDLIALNCTFRLWCHNPFAQSHYKLLNSILITQNIIASPYKERWENGRREGYCSFQRPPSAATSLSLSPFSPSPLLLLAHSLVAAAARPFSSPHTASEALGERTEKQRWRYRIWHPKEGGMLRWFPSFLSRHPLLPPPPPPPSSLLIITSTSERYRQTHYSYHFNSSWNALGWSGILPVRSSG